MHVSLRISKMGALHSLRVKDGVCKTKAGHAQVPRPSRTHGQTRTVMFSHAWPHAKPHVLARMATREPSCSRTHGHTRDLIAPQVWSQTDGWIAMADQYFSKCDPEIAQKINAAFAPIGGQSGLKVRPSDGMEHLCVRCATSATTRPRVNGNG